MVSAGRNLLQNVPAHPQASENKEAEIEGDIWEIYERIRGNRDQPLWGDLAEDEDAFLRSQALAESEKRQAVSQEGVEPCKAIWFVKEPKPFWDDTEAKRLERQFELQLGKVKLITEELRMKRKEKSETEFNIAVARRVYYETKNLANAKGRKLRVCEPGVQGVLVGSRKAKGRWSSDKANTTNQSEIQESEKILREELHLLQEEEASTKQVLKKLKRSEKAIERTLKQLLKQQSLEIDIKRSLHDSLQEARKEKRDQLAAFKANRTFSRMIRDMVKDGKVEEARCACLEQTEEMLQKMQDPVYRKQYVENCRRERFANKKPNDQSRHMEQEDGPRENRETVCTTVSCAESKSLEGAERVIKEERSDSDPAQPDTGLPAQLPQLRDVLISETKSGLVEKGSTHLDQEGVAVSAPDTPPLAKPENKPRGEDDFELPADDLQRAGTAVESKEGPHNTIWERQRPSSKEQTELCHQTGIIFYPQSASSAQESLEKEDVLQKTQIRRVGTRDAAPRDTTKSTLSRIQYKSQTKGEALSSSLGAEVTSCMKKGALDRIVTNVPAIDVMAVFVFAIVWGLICFAQPLMI